MRRSAQRRATDVMRDIMAQGVPDGRIHLGLSAEPAGVARKKCGFTYGEELFTLRPGLYGWEAAVAADRLKTTSGDQA